MCDRLTVIAGPKVYSSLKRRFSSLCFGTIKVPQSSGVSSEDAVMDPREVARAARRSIEIAHERLRLGDALLVFAEGTRSRTRGMQPMLAGVTRYLEVPDTTVLPVGIVGTEALFPIDDDALHPVRVEVRVGAPIAAHEVRERCAGDRQAMMDEIGRAIAALLPPEYRGAYERAESMKHAKALALLAVIAIVVVSGFSRTNVVSGFSQTDGCAGPRHRSSCTSSMAESSNPIPLAIG